MMDGQIDYHHYSIPKAGFEKVSVDSSAEAAIGVLVVILVWDIAKKAASETFAE